MTVKVLSRWEQFKRATVWHPLNTDPADTNRAGPRFWYPVYDLIAFALGASAFLIGSPLLNRLFPSWIVDTMGTTLMVAATLCFIGVTFPRLLLLELGGKLAIVFLLGGYAGTVAVMATTDEPNAFVVIILIMAVWMLGPRITKLFIMVSNGKPAKKELIP